MKTTGVKTKNIGYIGKFLACIIALGILPNNQAIAQNSLAEGVAAIVNDQPITSFDLRQRTRFLLITSGVTQPTQEMVQQASQQALNSLINEKLQIQEAAKFHVFMQDAEVDRILANQARQNGGTLAQFFNDLSSSGISIQSYRDKTRAEVLWQRIVSGRYGNRVKISPERVNEALSRILSTANRPQYQLSEIFIEVATQDEEAQALAGASTLVQQIRNGANFSRVAQQFSFAPSAAQGGDLGWVTQGELKPEVAQVIDQIQPGQVSEPIQVQGGIMIVGLRAKRAGQTPITTYSLKEINKAVPANADEATWRRAEAQVNAARSSLKKGCDGVGRAASRNGSTSLDLGQVQSSDLNQAYVSSLNGVLQGQATRPFRDNNAVHVVVVCSVDLTGQDIPTREQITDSMTDQELSLIARRYLRDLRREAAIVTR